jgi:hypothetical protein
VVGLAFAQDTDDQDLRDAVPSPLVDALPEVAPAVLFTAWSLARHGYGARDLSHLFTLTGEQSRTILAHAWSSTRDGVHRPEGAAPSSPDDRR